MSPTKRLTAVVALFAFCAGVAYAGKYRDAESLFRDAGRSAAYFDKSYAYAVFPNIGKGGFIVGGAHGTGHVLEKGALLGTATMNQVSVGFQAGGEDYSEIVFFEDKRALDEFTSGSFEFSADAGVVAIAAGASANVGTTGIRAGASGGDKDAKTFGGYRKGMAVFTIVKGGLMYDATACGPEILVHAT